MELLLDRIDRAERLLANLKRQTAPTVPMYGLSSVSSAPTWTLRSSPYDHISNNTNEDITSIWSESMGLFIAYTGQDTPYLITSPDGITWTANSNNFEFNQWSGNVGHLGLDDLSPLAMLYNENAIWTSPDGITWTKIIIPGTSTGNFNPNCSAYSSSLNLWVIGQSRLGGSEYAIVTTSDFSTFTNQTTPWNAPAGFAHHSDRIYVSKLCWSPDLNLFVGIGNNSQDGTTVLTSSDGVTWVGHNSPSDMFGNGWDVVWAPNNNLFVGVCAGFGGPTIATSPDGSTWTAVTDPFGGNEAECAIEVGGTIYVGGQVSDNSASVFSSTDGGTTWSDTLCPLGACASLAYSPSLLALVASGNSPAPAFTGPAIATIPI